jgi:Tfp pilus assembly protein PilX
MSYKKNNQKGIAVLLVIMILGVMMIISLAISDLVMNQLRLSVYSAESIYAYYAAESGLEDGLYKLRKEIWLPGTETPTAPVYLANQAYYVLEIATAGPLQIIKSEGNYQNTRRKLEASY